MEAEQDVAVKSRKKEKVKKAEHEQMRQLVEEVVGKEEENRAAIETELAVTPSMEVPKAMTGSPSEVEDIEEPSERQDEDIDERPYAQDWMIYPGTQLRRLLVRGKWVAWRYILGRRCSTSVT